MPEQKKQTKEKKKVENTKPKTTTTKATTKKTTTSKATVAKKDTKKATTSKTPAVKKETKKTTTTTKAPAVKKETKKAAASKVPTTKKETKKTTKTVRKETPKKQTEKKVVKKETPKVQKKAEPKVAKKETVKVQEKVEPKKGEVKTSKEPKKDSQIRKNIDKIIRNVKANKSRSIIVTVVAIVILLSGLYILDANTLIFNGNFSGFFDGSNKTYTEDGETKLTRKRAVKEAIKQCKKLGEKGIKEKDLEVMKIKRNGESYYYIQSPKNSLEIRIEDNKVTRINSIEIK